MAEERDTAATLASPAVPKTASSPGPKPVSKNTKAKPEAQANQIQHPKFIPAYRGLDTPNLLAGADGWVTPLSCPAYFPLEIFQSVLREMSEHPERNSSLILRSEPVPDMIATAAGSAEVDADDVLAARLSAGLEREYHKRLRFVPRQPRRDAVLEQTVGGYVDEAGSKGLVIKTPIADSAAAVPYYHPPVRKLAFLWESSEGEDGVTNEGETAQEPAKTGEEPAKVYGRISISYLPFGDTPTSAGGFLAPPPKPPRKRSPLAGGDDAAPPPATVLEDDSAEAAEDARVLADRRLQRTCRALLERLHKHGHGTLLGYVKRVHHDVIVSRTPFQDLYQALKERHKHLDSRVPKAWSTKVEDVKRHVWKDPGSPDDRLLPTDLSSWGQQDIAIAAFLMLLWRDMYPAVDAGDDGVGMEWDQWGRPPAGLVDLGCGNGLVVHILVSEGYKANGYELRARRTWPQYPEATQAALHELPIHMPSWFPRTMDEWDAGMWDGRDECVITEGCFILGNHADELTPWIPLLSLIPETPVPYLNLPCCLHTLDGNFTSLEFVPPPHEHTPEGGLEAGLEAGVSRYKAYVMWLAYRGLLAGWVWEKESLRIPSTRGIGITARKRWTKTAEDLRTCRAWALDEVEGVRVRGAFKIRQKEGKDH